MEEANDGSSHVELQILPTIKVDNSEEVPLTDFQTSLEKEGLNDTDDEIMEGEINVLQDLLVPVTVLSTKEDDEMCNSKIKVQQAQHENRRVKPRKYKKSTDTMGNGFKNFVQLSLEEMSGESLKLSNEENSQEDDEEEDEFEDERELEGGNKYGIKIEQLDHLRPPVIMPMPVMKRASLCLQEKAEIIKELEGGEKQSWICKRKRLPKSTVQSIWKNREKILQASEKIGMGRKRCRRAQHENIEDKLVEWIETLKSQNVPVNGPQLRAKAQVFAKQLGVADFRSSTGWLDKFKTRHNIAFKKSMKINSGASGVGNKKVAIDWVTKVWPNMCEGYTSENIFNVDEFGLFYSALPDVAPKLVNETCHGGRMAQDRLTVLLCANSDGTEKRPLTVVGNMNIIGPINMYNLPVNYVADSKAWMTRSIFVEELRKWDEELRGSSRNILILLDNSPAHIVTETFSNIKLVFLPPVVASILQPLEHGIMNLVKIQYRRLLLDRIIRKYQVSNEDQISAKSVDNSINVMEAIVMLNAAWSSVSPDSILESFKTSNLQSINVSNSTTSLLNSNVSRSRNADNELRDAELMERVSLYVPNLHIPPTFSLSNYGQIDDKLHVTDYINDEHQNKSCENAIGSLTITNLETPTKTQVQEYLSSIRNWVMSLPVNVDDNSIHNSLSILDNFVLSQPHEIPRPTPPQLPFHITTSPTTLPSINRQQNNLNRMILNGSIANGVDLSQPSNVLTMPSAHNSTSNSNSTTVVTFTLTDPLQQHNLPHHIIDQQQFFAYLA